jgi:hypothetical protein
MEEQMFKRVLITAAVIAVALPVEASAARVATATAPGQLTCKQAAKLQFPNEHAMRKAFKKECKQAYKASRAPAHT